MEKRKKKRKKKERERKREMKSKREERKCIYLMNRLVNSKLYI